MKSVLSFFIVLIIGLSVGFIGGEVYLKSKAKPNNTPRIDTLYVPQEKTFIHECGHALDSTVGVASGEGRLSNNMPATTLTMSHSQEFSAIYAKYRDNPKLWDYMRSNPHEMFAEGYAMYYHTPEKNALLKQVAPDLHAYFGSLHDKIEGMAAKAAKESSWNNPDALKAKQAV